MPHRFTVVGLALVGVISVTALNAQTPAPDNTKVNVRDRSKDAVTADQQKENAADRDLTQKIRQALVKDKSLSTYAHNVKVVAQEGRVTLKGPVRTAAERQSVEAKAIAIAGEGHVSNEFFFTEAKTTKKATK